MNSYDEAYKELVEEEKEILCEKVENLLEKYNLSKNKFYRNNSGVSKKEFIFNIANDISDLVDKFKKTI